MKQFIRKGENKFVNPACVDLNPEARRNDSPVKKLALIILRQAVLDNAESIELTLRDANLSEVEDPETVSPNARMISELTEQQYDRKKFEIQVTCQSKSHNLPCPAAHLYDPIVHFFLTLVDLPYWAKGHVQAELATKNPESRWCIVSENPRAELKLARVRLA